MSLQQSVRGSISSLAIAQVAQRVTGLATAAILARLLSPEDFGLLALASIAVGLFSIFGDVGLGSALIQRAEVDQELLSSAFWMNVCIGAAVAGVGVLAAPLAGILVGDMRTVPILRALMVTLVFTSVSAVSGALLQRRMEFRKVALLESGGSAGSGAIGIVLALAGAGVWALVAQSIAMSAILSLGRLAAAGWLPSPRFTPHRSTRLMAFGASVLGCSLVNYGARRIDNAIIGTALGAEALGYYYLAYTLILMPGMGVGSVVGRVMFPALSSLQDDPARRNLAYLRMVRVVGVMTLPLVFGLWATAPLLVRLVYGPQWEPAAYLIQVLAVVGAWEAVNTAGVVFFTMGRPNLLLKVATLSVAVMTVAFAAGVRWGLPGVAWAYVAITPVVFLTPHVYAGRLLGMPWRSYVRAVALPVAAASVMVVAVRWMLAAPWPDWLRLAAAIAVGVVTYALALRAMATLSNEPSGMRALLGGEGMSRGAVHLGTA